MGRDGQCGVECQVDERAREGWIMFGGIRYSASPSSLDTNCSARGYERVGNKTTCHNGG